MEKHHGLPIPEPYVLHEGANHFPKSVGIVFSAQKWQLQEKGNFIQGGRYEPYTKTWGGWEKEEDARKALEEYKKSKEKV